MTSLAELLVNAARSHADNAAVVDDDWELTYGQLERRVAGAVHVLDDRGIGPGDRVAVVTDTTVVGVVWIWAVLWVGATLVPMHNGLKPFARKQIYADCSPAAIIADDESGPGVEALTMPAEMDPRAVTTPDIAMLIYTSGSTGHPKGVVCPHDACLFAVSAIAKRLRYSATDTVLLALPLSFDYGLYQILLGTQARAAVVLTTPADVFGTARAIDEHRVSVVPVVPASADLLTLALRRARRPRPTIRLLTSTGAALPPGTAAGLRDVFSEASIVPMYGITECKRVSIGEPDEDLIRPGSSGIPLDDTTVVIRDELGQPVPDGTVGEITVSGRTVMSGYWNAESTRFRSADDRTWLHTGDRGSIDDTGRIHVVGRSDDIFKRSGVRTSVGEVEAAAIDIPGVCAAVALPPDTSFDLDIVVQSEHLNSAGVLAALRERLEIAKVPARCAVVDTVPVTANGKLDRVRIRTDRADGTLRWTR